MSHRYTTLVLILAAQTAANVGPLGLPAIASLIRSDLDLSLAQAGSFISAYYIGPILMSLPAGAIADLWGVKRALVIGQVLIAGGLLAASQSTSYGMLVGLLIVAGFGYGFLNPTSTKAVMAWFPPSQAATVVGLKQVGLPFGGMLGAALLPVLALGLGWRSAVGAAAVPIAISAVATLVIYREPEARPAAPVPSRAPGALRPVRAVLRSRDLWLVALSTLVFAAVQTVWMAYLVLYLETVLGLSLIAAGRYLALAQLGGMTGRVAFGVLSDRAFGGNRRLPLVVAGFGSALCSLAIAATGAGTSAAWLVSLALVFGFVGIGWNGVQHTLMAELAGARAAGAAVGLGLAVASLGVTLGPPVFGWAVTAGGSFTGPWIGVAATTLGSLLLLAPVRERRGA